tara:strand:- start:155 stop:658 length:504 start_codon:yes stop_codon:yes gene_type:complete
MGWSKKSNSVLLDDNLETYLDVLSSKLPFDIMVTSGIRTARQQALAMFKKVELGEDLTVTYRDDDFATDMMEAYPDIQKGEQIVKAYFARGGGSSHQRNMAIDLRTRDKTQSQIQQMIQAVESLGDYALLEPTPPHLHITLKKNYQKGNPSRFLILALILGAAWMAI